MHEETIEIGDKTDIGRAIMAWQALLCASEAIRLRFTDGGKWIGGCTITRADDDLTYNVDGCLFKGSGDDKGVGLHFTGEGDGPIGLPLRAANGLLFTDDVDLAAWDAAVDRDPAIIAGLCEDGAMVSRATAGKAKRVDGEKLSGGRKLARQADDATMRWFKVVDHKLVEQTPKSDSWPRRMPRPAKPTPEPVKVKGEPVNAALKAAPVAEKRAVHKRAGKGAPVVALTKVA